MNESGRRAAVGSASRVSITVIDQSTDLYRFRRLPGLTAHVLLSYAVEALASRRTLSPLQATLVSLLSERQVRAVGVMINASATYAPDGAIPDDIDVGSSRSGSDSVAGADARTIEGQLVRFFGDGVPERWFPVLERPEAWLDHVAAAHRSIAPVIADVWAEAQHRISFEQYRFDLALSGGGALPAFVNHSGPFELSGDVLSLPYPRAQRLAAVGPLLVAPIVTTPDQALLLSRRSSLVVGYPTASLPGVDVRSEIRLVSLLGPARSAILASATGTRTMGELARLLHYAPSTLTHHTTTLERSGLIELRRDGPNVFVRRTPAGEMLLDLLA